MYGLWRIKILLGFMDFFTFVSRNDLFFEQYVRTVWFDFHIGYVAWSIKCTDRNVRPNGKENVKVLHVVLYPAFLFKKSWIIWKLSALKFKVINVSALKFTERELIEVKLKCIFQIQRIFAMVIEIRNIYNLVFLIGFLRWNKTCM